MYHTDTIGKIVAWFPQNVKTRLYNKMSKPWIERHFQDLCIDIESVFYKRTWSLDFIERTLRPEQTELWDHVSVWYTLNEQFCERNIEWLNFYELVYSQALNKDFYLRHLDKIDWIPKGDENILRRELYSKLYKRG